jgi:ribonuclease HI
MYLCTDHDKPPKQCLHPADRKIAIDTDNTQEDPTHINVYTDGSKSEQGVGAGTVITRPGTTIVEMMYRMNTRCTNNQEEAFAILKALEYVQTKLDNEVDKVTTVHKESMTTLESLNNVDKHTFLTEEMRQKVQEMGSRGWTTRFRWTKAHAGTTGNKLADKLAKEALSKTIIPISYNRAPKSVINRDLEDNSRETWQKEWETTNKGTTTKEYFPTVVERLKMKINLTQHLTTLVVATGTYNHIYTGLES